MNQQRSEHEKYVRSSSIEFRHFQVFILLQVAALDLHRQLIFDYKSPSVSMIIV